MIEVTLTQELLSLVHPNPALVRFCTTPGIPHPRPQSGNLAAEIRATLTLKGIDPAQVCTSASDTFSEAGGAVLVAGCTQKIGVDIEDRRRSVDPRVEPRLLSKHEKGLGLSLLESWVVKEAAFKANPFNRQTFLPQYQLVAYLPSTHRGQIQLPSTPSGQTWLCDFSLLTLENWVVALAVARQG